MTRWTVFEAELTHPAPAAPFTRSSTSFAIGTRPAADRSPVVMLWPFENKACMCQRITSGQPSRSSSSALVKPASRARCRHVAGTEEAEVSPCARAQSVSFKQTADSDDHSHLQ